MSFLIREVANLSPLKIRVLMALSKESLTRIKVMDKFNLKRTRAFEILDELENVRGFAESTRPATSMIRGKPERVFTLTDKGKEFVGLFGVEWKKEWEKVKPKKKGYYSCPECLIQFHSPESLSKHVERMHKEKPKRPPKVKIIEKPKEKPKKPKLTLKEIGDKYGFGGDYIILVRDDMGEPYAYMPNEQVLRKRLKPAVVSTKTYPLSKGVLVEVYTKRTIPKTNIQDIDKRIYHQWLPKKPKKEIAKGITPKFSKVKVRHHIITSCNVCDKKLGGKQGTTERGYLSHLKRVGDIGHMSEYKKILEARKK